MEKGIVRTFSAVADKTTLIVRFPGELVEFRFSTSPFTERLAAEIRAHGVECSEEAVEKLADEVA